MEFVITNNLGQVLVANLDAGERLGQLLSCQRQVENVTCIQTSKSLKQGVIDEGDYILYLSCEDSNLTNKIFKHYLNFFKVIAREIVNSIDSTRAKENQKTRRLKHNLINYNAGILLELYRLFSQEKFKQGANHVDVIQQVIKQDPRSAAFAFLKVLKNSNLMKAEFDVYEMLDQESPYLDFSEHQIHKVVMLTINPFWLDLIEKGVNIIVQPFFESISIDYKTISVALSHIFDNATKYVLSNSDFKIFFENNSDCIKISFDMISLKIEPQEVEFLFEENKSGFWAEKLGLSGDGIGMFVINKLIKLNHGQVNVKPNIDKSKAVNSMGLPYENNVIELILPKVHQGFIE